MSNHSHQVPKGVNPDIDRFLHCQHSHHVLYEQYGECEPIWAEPIRLVETHCACVYLGLDFVIKIKRAVSYSYIALDTLERRRQVCERELELNRSSLPDIYLSVAAIVENDKGLLQLVVDTDSIESDHCIREWCVVMRRFDESNVLDRVVDRGEFTTSLADSTGRSIANYHRELPFTPCNDGDIRIDELISELEFELKQLNKIIPYEEVNKLIEAMYVKYKECQDLLRSRSEKGFVKRCHGDLHLRNMLLVDQKPIPFDALEFDERLATTDVLYDLAFTIMDLYHRQLSTEANRVLNAYLAHSEQQNIAAMSLMSLFISIRAAIKAMTTGQSMPKESVDKQRQDVSGITGDALTYLALAQNALNPKDGQVIAIGGFSGSGKSTIAREIPAAICGMPGAILLQSDIERKVAFNVDETQILNAGHYTKKNSQRVYQRVLGKVQLAVEQEYPVVVDATFLSTEQRNNIEAIAVNAGIAFRGFWLMAPVEIMKKRILNRRYDASDADVSVLEKQLKRDKGNITWQIVDTDSPVKNTVERIVNAINRNQQVEPLKTVVESSSALAQT